MEGVWRCAECTGLQHTGGFLPLSNRVCCSISTTQMIVCVGGVCVLCCGCALRGGGGRAQWYWCKSEVWSALLERSCRECGDVLNGQGYNTQVSGVMCACSAHSSGHSMVAVKWIVKVGCLY